MSERERYWQARYSHAYQTLLNAGRAMDQVQRYALRYADRLTARHGPFSDESTRSQS